MLKNYKNLSLFHKTLISSLFFSTSIAALMFVSSLYIQNKMLVRNIINQSSEIGETWSYLLNENLIYEGLNDFNPESRGNKILIDQLTFLTEQNDNIAQAYLFEAEIVNEKYTKTLAQPKNILRKGAILGKMQEQPEEWLNAASLLLKENESTHTEIYTDILGTWITTLHPIYYKNEIIAIFAIDMDASIVKKGQMELFISLFTLFIIFIIFIFIFKFFVVKKMFYPLQQVIKGINEVSKGNFNVKIPNSESKDLNNLIDNFNHMVMELNQLYNSVLKTSEVIDSKYQYKYPHEKSKGYIDGDCESSDLQEALLKINEIKDKTILIDTLHYAEKINSIAQLAAVFAHELRNPLTTVLGFIKLLSHDQRFKGNKEILDLMKDELESVERKIERYIYYAQPQISEFQQTDVKEILNSSIELLLPSCQGIEFKLSIEQSAIVIADPIELTQVFLNILQNSIETMNGCGRLSIVLSSNNEYITVSIKDTGEGMTQEEVNKLGTPFYSTKIKGTGVGLTKVFFVVSKMKGKIKIKSKKGEGTTFTILLPKPMQSELNCTTLHLPTNLETIKGYVVNH